MSNPTAAYSAEIRVRLENRPGTLGRLCVAIGHAGGNIRSLEGFRIEGDHLMEEVIVDATSEQHIFDICAAVHDLDGIDVISSQDRTFYLHEGGKLETGSRIELLDNDDLAMAYTPGVARICLAIDKRPDLVHRYTIKGNTVAIVTDGSAVLGLGNIGPEAALPVMEGKALLFKEFAGVDAFPICLNTQDPDEIVETVIRIAPTFGGINLEDIAAPGAFEIEARLREALDIPVFHDDQHGTAVVALAALRNSLKVVGKVMGDISVVISGAGAAGVAIARILQGTGVGEIIVVDRSGTIHAGRSGLHSSKQWLADNTNPRGVSGTVGDAMVGADVFMGVSAPGVITRADVEAMADDPIVFAMANPEPEIRPETIQDVAAVIATGRSDFPNQINNVLAFPGIFRGAFMANATDITEGMKIAAAEAIAAAVPSEELTRGSIMPSAFDRSVVEAVAPAVAQAAVRDGVTRV